MGRTAGLCQRHTAVHQASLNSGRWRTAGPLLPYADSAARPEFGDSHDELAATGSLQKALMERKGSQPVLGPRTAGSQRQPKATPPEEQVEGEAGGEHRAQKAKGRNKEEK